MDRDTAKPLKELLDSVRDIDGFPIAKDENILALSDPPFYTACPNPYIKQSIEEYGKPYDPDNDNYNRESFVGDVSEGKNDPIYHAHAYHTKVPHKAIMKYIEHYTNPGDIVFDGFCGSGMTGVAAQITKRRTILSDLCPSATFVSYNHNSPIDSIIFEKEANKILGEVEEECGWMYETNHNKDNGMKNIVNKEIGGKINYIVWSDIFVCPYCSAENIFDEVATGINGKKVKRIFECSTCGAELKKSSCKRAAEIFYDSALGKEVTHAKQVPVLINYSVGKKNYDKKPNDEDLKLIKKINNMEIPYWFPTDQMPEGFNTRQPKISHGLTHVHHFYTKRNLWALAKIFDLLNETSECLKAWLFFTYEQAIMGMSKWARYVPTHYSQVNQGLSGTLYIGSRLVEVSPSYIIENKIKRLANILKKIESFNIKSIMVSTQSSTQLKNINDNSIDYIFTDPPFGSNLMYSELSFIWESWLKVFTNNKSEAVINKYQNKDLSEYTELMTNAFKEMYRILKPNRWTTIVFHNSKASVWNAIQESITRAGFIVAQVAVLDKKQGSFKQVTSAGAVKNDLVINAYKPKTDFSKRFLKNAGEGMEIDFVIQQSEHLPVKPNIERTEKMLYSKMLAHYVENGFKIKYDSTNFYKLLSDNLVELDGYWFLDSQVKEYNKWKSGLSLEQIKNVLDGQQVLFVSDEKSALAWLYNFLHQPRTYSEIYIAYQQVATTTDDKIPEPKELLDNNFIVEYGKYRRPISREEREGINKNRERELDRTFQNLLKQTIEPKGRIRNVRREALIYGFTKCYQEGRYQDILTVANRLYASTLEASGDIMDFIDIARIKTSGEEKKQRTIDNEFPLWR